MGWEVVGAVGMTEESLLSKGSKPEAIRAGTLFPKGSKPSMLWLWLWL